MMRVLAKASRWQEDGSCGNKQGKNKAVGISAWSSRTGEVLQQLGFGNPVSSSNVVHFISNDSFYVIGFFILWFVGLCVIMTMFSLSFLWGILFLFVIYNNGCGFSTFCVCSLFIRSEY